MKRINKDWWKGSDGYYLEVSRNVYEGPFDEMNASEDNWTYSNEDFEENIVEVSEEIVLKPAPREVKVDIKFDDE